MQADPVTTDEYVPPGLVYKCCLFLAFACGIALIVPLHRLTANRAVASSGAEREPRVHLASARTAASTDAAQLASSIASAHSYDEAQASRSEALPAEPMPFEPLPLEPLPLQPMGEELASLEPQPFETAPFSAGSTGALRQPPEIDDAFVFQEEPAEAVAADEPVPPPSASASAPAPQAPAIAADPVESPSDAAVMPMPEVAEAMPAPAIAEQAPAPVMDLVPTDVAPLQVDRGITCTSPVPEPVVLRAVSPPTQSHQAGYAPASTAPAAQRAPAAQYLPQGVPAAQYLPQGVPAAQARPQAYRPAAPQPRQSFNHPGYGRLNDAAYSR